MGLDFLTGLLTSFRERGQGPALLCEVRLLGPGLQQPGRILITPKSGACFLRGHAHDGVEQAL